MSANGQLPASTLATIPGTTRRVRADLLAQTVALRAAFEKRFGRPLIVTDGYRSYAAQAEVFQRYYTTDYAASAKIDRKVWNGRVWWRRPGFPSAAIPGLSNHGWGQAIDFGSGVNTSLTSPEHLWMRANAGRFGWSHPFWAHDPARPHLREPWHFEAVAVPVSNYQTFLSGAGITVPTLPGLTPPTPIEEDPLAAFTEEQIRRMMRDEIRTVLGLGGTNMSMPDLVELVRLAVDNARLAAGRAQTGRDASLRAEQLIRAVASSAGVDAAAVAEALTPHLVPALVDILTESTPDLTVEQVQSAAETAVRNVLGSLA